MRIKIVNKKSRVRHEKVALKEGLKAVEQEKENGSLATVEDGYMFLDGFMAGYVSAVYNNKLVNKS